MELNCQTMIHWKLLLLNYNHLSNTNKLFLRIDELFNVLINDDALSHILVDILDNNPRQRFYIQSS